MKTRNFAAMAAATLGLALTASPALADTTDAPAKTIEYDDLNLDTPEGQARLERRIESAVRSVCSAHEIRTGTRVRSPHLRACLADARASGKKQMANIMAEHRRGG